MECAVSSVNREDHRIQTCHLKDEGSKEVSELIAEAVFPCHLFNIFKCLFSA